VPTTSTPFTYLTPAGRFDRRAIMQAAHVDARKRMARAIELGMKAPRYAIQFRHALSVAWDSARTYRDCARRDAELDTMSAPVARLVEARMFAVHIDSSREMIRCITAIDAQLATLQVMA